MKRIDVETKNMCGRCGNTMIITDHEAGETVCQVCGYVISEKIISDLPEWRSSFDKKSQSRVGPPSSLSKQNSLSTIIDPSNHDSTGKPFSTSTKFALNRIRLLDNRSRVSDNNNRNLVHALTKLQIMKEKLALPDSVAENAAYIYKKAIERKLLQGRTITALVGAAVYAACRNSETPRTLRDIMKAGNIKYKILTKNYRLLVREFDLQIPVANSDQCVSRIASRAGLSEKVKRYAIEILKKADRKKISSGKHPMGLAAAALYFACIQNNGNTSQKEIAVAADVSEVTIRNRLKGLKPVMQELMFAKNF